MNRPSLFALVLLLATGACGSEPGGDQAQAPTSSAAQARRGDAAVQAQVKQTLDADPVLKSAEIQVLVENGVVTLASDKTDKAQRDAAVRVARQVDGVRDVIDKMK